MSTLKKILHVEDDASIQMVTRVALQSVGGFEVLSCFSGREALAQVHAFAPDLIMLDVMMPDLDGPATLKALSEIIDIRQTPVIFLTAKVQAQELERYLSLGAIGVIIKPFNPMTLSTEVRALWAHRPV